MYFKLLIKLAVLFYIAILDMARRQNRYSYNSECEEQYCFIDYRGKPVCLLCIGSVSVPKKSNVELHFLTNHNYWEIWTKKTKGERPKI